MSPWQRLANPDAADIIQPVGPGSQIGSYRVLRLLGEGGMGMVFEAVNDLIDRRAAIKILRPEWSTNPDIAARFLNEARAVNQVKHPGVVNIYDFGKLPDGTAYIVMEFLEGESLHARMHRSGKTAPLPSPDVVRLANQLASALIATHAKGIVHRDLKPENIMIVRDPDVPSGERAKILDFGLAKLAPEARPGRVQTQSAIGMGTPDYMAPEQCVGANKVDGKADVYSMGIILFELLSGQLPFLGGGEQVLMKRITLDAPELLSVAPQVDPAIAALVQSMLARERDNRPTIIEVKRALDELQLGGPPGPIAPMPQPEEPAAPRDSLALGLQDTVPDQQYQRRKWLYPLLGGLAALVVGGTALWNLTPNKAGLQRSDETTRSVSLPTARPVDLAASIIAPAPTLVPDAGAVPVPLAKTQDEKSGVGTGKQRTGKPLTMRNPSKLSVSQTGKSIPAVAPTTTPALPPANPQPTAPPPQYEYEPIHKSKPRPDGR